MPAQAAFRHTVEEHLAALASLMTRIESRVAETVPLRLALNRAVATDIISPVPLPLFRNAQMDGFAVRSTDVAAAPINLPVMTKEIAAAAGEPDPLSAGMAARIMTGAPMPAGADTVVPVEQTRPGDGTVDILAPSNVGRYVREAGSDLPAGSLLLPAGALLGSRQLAALAAAGLDQVPVRTPVRVAVLSTGSEIVPPGAVPAPGELFDSNSIALWSAAIAAGGVVVHTARVRDDDSAFLAELDAAIDAGAELIVTSGGVSMGEHEVVRETLEPLGVLVGKVAMQPGGPQGYGRYREIPVLCFPGNPVSSQLSFELFAAPLVRRVSGRPPARLSHERVAVPIELFDSARRQYQRGHRTDDGRVVPVGGPGSHLVAALAAAELLIVLPDGSGGVDENDEVEVLWLS